MAHSSGIRRPIQIQEFVIAIRESSEHELQEIRKEINNAVKHLQRSNRRLEAYVAKLKGEEVVNRQELDAEGNFSDDDIDEKDLQVFQDSLAENEKVLDNYNERLQALDLEEQHRASTVSSGDIQSASTKLKKSLQSQGRRTDGVDSDNTADATGSNSINL
ncbi:Tma17 [Kluyveromyces lactis]|nr:Tma17 [Kluyveromyces lactis]